MDNTNLTVGRVSSLIALGHAILNITFPLLIVLVLVRYNEKTMSAATSSVLARQLHSTAWPSLLQSDSTVTKNVKTDVAAISYVKIALALLGVISGIVTPLGLGEEIRPGPSQLAHFDYVPDLSSFGKSTMARPDMPLSRECGIQAGVFCPGAFVPGLAQNASGDYTFSDPTAQGTTMIPKNVTAMFTSASKNSSIAGIFDLQYRTWAPARSPLLNNNQPFPIGHYVHIDSLLNREGFITNEGIIADMTSGGVGFRNHSAPLDAVYGAEWTEDILWVEPEVSCTNTNLSVLLTLGNFVGSNDVVDAVEVVDDGGFARLRRGNVKWLNLTYAAPRTRLRAETAAWESNILTAIRLNITDFAHASYGLNVTMGHHYPIPKSTTWDIDSLGILTTALNGDWLDVPQVDYNRDGSITAANRTIHSPDEDPYLWAAGKFGEIAALCNLMNLDVSKSWDRNVICGYLFASPRPLDNDSPYEAVGSRWKSSIFVCAGAVQASVRTASFRFNSTQSLPSLVTKDVVDKVYDSPSEYPLWAMEDWRYPGNNGSRAGSLWGVVASSYEGALGYNFTRAPSFYLPYAFDALIDTAPDILAGTVAPQAVLEEVLSTAFRFSSNGKIPRYSGVDSAVLRDKWRNFSSTSNVESIIKLVWTDMMASFTVGTSSKPPRLATVYDRRVTYDVRYAVPSILFLILWTLLLLMGSILRIYDRKLIPNLKSLLNNTSVGRIAIRLGTDNHKHLRQASTKDWVSNAGHFSVHIGEVSDTTARREQALSTRQAAIESAPFL